ncbi:MAG: hypothetical protein CL489_11875 [Acidobacteria bacterium]|nr:hypothetical protein [Acidobacteriota bacterium]
MKDQSFFIKVVDDLIDFADNDPELKDGIRWVDKQANEKGISFYDMVYEILYKHETRSKAKEWLDNK